MRLLSFQIFVLVAINALFLHSLASLVLPLGFKGAMLAGTAPEDVPLEVRAGVAAAAEGILPDLPFTPERGYGHVGGQAGSLAGAAVLGGDPSWEIAWREGMEQYSFRLPRGEYLIELSLIETEVAQPGLRVFDVLAEGRELFGRVDIAALAGDFTWLKLCGLVPVYDGWLDLRFVSATPDRPPRVSRLCVAAGDTQRKNQLLLPQVPRLEAVAGPERVNLRWDPLSLPGVAGYGVFRSESRDGPYDSLTEAPIQSAGFEDYAAAPGVEHFYKLRAYSLEGGQSAFSEVAAATPFRLHDLGLKVYGLNVQAEEMRRLLARREPGAEVSAALSYLGASYQVFLRCDTTARGWQRKKSFFLTLDSERNRFFQRRRALYLSAEVGDLTYLKEMLCAASAQAVGLAAPAVEPVALVLNGRFLGVYFDIEVLDGRFLNRSRLDRAGLFARLAADDHLRTDWMPMGEMLNRGGNLMGLVDLVHQLNRLGEGEMTPFFERNLYLDRYLTWRALAAARGEVDAPLAGLCMLHDSRNSKWEFFRDAHTSGDWGVQWLEPPPADVTEPRRMLLGRSLQGGAQERGEWSVFETRFFNQPEHLAEYLVRLERLLAEDLAPEKLDALVDAAYRTIEKAAVHDALIWLSPARKAAFLAGPEKLKAAHRARCEALRRVLAEERRQPPSPLVLNELLAAPGEAGPGEDDGARKDDGAGAWVELHNRSQAPVDLRRYTLTDDPAAPAKVLLPAETLAPGGFLLVKLAVKPAAGASPPVSVAGGFLGLYSQAEPGRAIGPSSASSEPRDFLFFGHQTAGFSYGRMDGASDRWGFLAAPTPAAANQGSGLRPPPYEFRQGVDKAKSGDLTVWLRPAWTPGSDDARSAKVVLEYREEGAAGYDAVNLAWNDKVFRHEVSLKASPARLRTAYYFLAATVEGIERTYPLPAPELTYYLPVLPDLKLNEVLPRPPRQPGSPGEFIEIYNPSDRAVELSGMFLTDSQRNTTKWRIPPGQKVPPKGFAVFHASGLNRGNETSFRLSNSGEFLGLYGSMEEGNLLIDNIAFRGMRPGESWGRTTDGAPGFRAWKDPTPGARNIPKIPPEYLEKKNP